MYDFNNIMEYALRESMQVEIEGSKSFLKCEGGAKSKQFTVYVSQHDVAQMNKIIHHYQLYRSRSEFILTAVRNFLRKWLPLIEQFQNGEIKGPSDEKRNLLFLNFRRSTLGNIQPKARRFNGWP